MLRRKASERQVLSTHITKDKSCTDRKRADRVKDVRRKLKTCRGVQIVTHSRALRRHRSTEDCGVALHFHPNNNDSKKLTTRHMNDRPFVGNKKLSHSSRPGTSPSSLAANRHISETDDNATVRDEADVGGLDTILEQSTPLRQQHMPWFN